MGYACPVCDTPQADARHLANHLAFTAMLHGDDHETWLDEHVPDWAAAGEADLADRVESLAEAADYEQVFEDTAGGLEDPAAGPPGVDPDTPRAGGGGELDAETRAVLEEARDLTRRMLSGADEPDGNGGTDDGDRAADTGGHGGE